MTLQNNTYKYDVFGEITEKSTSTDGNLNKLVSVNMEYDSANRLISYNGEEVTYDVKGNMTKGPVDGEMTELTYDCRNRLVKAGKVSYTYDCENTRIATEEDGITTEYVTETGGSLSRMLIAYENVGTDKVSETHYYYGAEGLSCQNNDTTGQYFAYHYDNIGSTTLITDKVGRIIEKFAYGTYGELLTEVVNNIRFLYNGSYGVVTDSNGLYYMRARYYNPDIKRFINQDIKVGDISNGQGLNRYAYCEGNPVSMVDPFGLCGENANEQGEVSKYQWLHNALDIAGLAFDVADVINAGVYALEGKWGQAAVSLACALPAIGTAIAGVSKATKFAKVGNIIGQTMKYAGKAYMTVQTATQALELAGDAKVQYAVNGGKVTPDMALNIAGAAAMGALAVMSAGNLMKDVTSLTKASGIKMETTVRDVADSISGKVEKGSGISGGSGSSGRGMMKNKNRGCVVWPFGKGGSGSDELVHVYRGTNRYTELSVFEETGHLMSDSTRNAYLETGNLKGAYAQSNNTHNNWLKIWGNESDYVQAHAAFGTELSEAFGLDRTFMSVTTDLNVARKFAGEGGRVFEAYIPRSQLIKQTLSGAGESEYLIRFGSGGFK